MTTPRTPYTARFAPELTGPLVAEPLPFVAVAGGTLIMTGECLVTGLMIRNTGANAVVRGVLYDGTDANGTPLFINRLAASGTQQPPWSAVPVIAKIGLFWVDDQAAAEGVIWVVKP